MDEREILVSVFVLTYNHEKYLRQAIESVLMQRTRFRYELLIGDDASTDGTARIAREYAGRYADVVQVIEHPVNVGATRNLYDLFERARGRYIASCEGDDYWLDPEKLQKQVDFMESHPEYSGHCHACRVVDEGGNAVARARLRWESHKRNFTLRDFDGLHLPGQPATLVHVNFFRNPSHNYSIIYTAHPQVADRTIMLILTLLGPVYRDEAVLSCYRVGSGKSSMTQTQFADNKRVNSMQVRYLDALSRYALEEFGVRKSFFRFRTEQRIKAFFKETIASKVKERLE